MNSTVQSYLKISSDIGAHPIPEVLSCLSTGSASCSLSGSAPTDGQVISLCAVVPLHAFESVSFRGYSLSINSWIAIADACAKCRTLNKIAFSECSFKDGSGILTFAKALGNAEVNTLEINGCIFGDDLVSGLAESKMLLNDRLGSLTLSSCDISCEGVCRLAKALESVGMMSSLKILDLSRNRIGDRGACALAAILIGEGANSSIPLQTLELESNKISDIGSLALCRAAKSALVMSRLNLSHNNLSEASLAALADALRFNTGTLKEVAVAGCRATEESLIAVLKAVTKNNTLQLLDLRGVGLGPDGVAQLCQMLRYSATLCTLKIDVVAKEGADGVAQLCQMLRYSATLRTLKIDVVAKEGADGVAQLCQMLRYSATLRTLKIDVVAKEGADVIANELPFNRSLMHLTLGGPVPESLLKHMSNTLAANAVRSEATGPGSATSPHIHAWIEDANGGSKATSPLGKAQFQGYGHTRRSSPLPILEAYAIYQSCNPNENDSVPGYPGDGAIRQIFFLTLAISGLPLQEQQKLKIS
eukprot:gene31870-7078_t